MSEVQCKRCGKTARGLDRAPLPGEVGELLREGTCAACWRGWLDEQVKLINELQLTPVNPEHYELLVERMKAHLKLTD